MDSSVAEPTYWVAGPTAKESLWSRASATELLETHTKGLVTRCEVLGMLWDYCHDKPEITRRLISEFRMNSEEWVRDLGNDLESFAIQYQSAVPVVVYPVSKV